MSNATTTTEPRPVMTREELSQHKLGSHGRDYSRSDDGYGDMDVAAEEGWLCVPGWARDGFDLGNWPYVAFYVRNRGTEDPQRYQMQTIVEGDHDVYGFASQAEREAAIDYLFIWYGLGREYEEWMALGPAWRDSEAGRAALDAGLLAVPARLRGPFSWARIEREDERAHGRCEVCNKAISDDEHAKLESDIDFVEHGNGDERHAIRRKRVWCLEHQVPYEPQDKHAEDSPLSCPVCDSVEFLNNPKPDMEES